jgi:hypothetical protein
MARMLSSRKGYHPMLCGDEGPVPQQDRAVRLRDQCCMHDPPPIPNVGCLGVDGSESRKLQYCNFSIIRRTSNGEWGNIARVGCACAKRMASDLPRQTRRPPDQG